MVYCDASTMDAPEKQQDGTLAESLDDADDLICLRVRELTKASIKICVASTTTIGAFINDAAKQIGIPADEIELTYQDKTTFHIYTLSLSAGNTQNLTFSALNIHPSKTQEYTVIVNRKKKKKKPVRYIVDDEVDDDITSAAEPPLAEAEPEPSTSRGATSAARSSAYLEDYVGKEFVGLKNQKSTCYMNSLLQSLFFCPEFRNAIYLHNFEYDPHKKSIGMALQRLFLRLQFSNRSSIETDEITRTFGWKDHDSGIQQDIEELYRIIMDLLGDEFRKSAPNSITESLYGGLLTDYVECVTCHKRNDKRTMFLAVHLPVRLANQPLPNPTLEEALKCFVAAELLNEKNQYKCEACNKLVDAHKGLSFEQLPYFMCIQLQRSEFDYDRMTRRKCSDKVGFPTILDLNEFVIDKRTEDERRESVIAPIELDKIRGEKYTEIREAHSRPNVQLPTELEKKNDGNYENNQTVIKEMLQRGPNVYQLFSVLIHRGYSSHAGHYFAYILDPETNRWFLFNDAIVRRILETDITETFGCTNSSGEESGHGIAYMLIYRKIDPLINSLPLTLAELPPAIAELWKTLEAEDNEAHAKETYERSIMKAPVYLRLSGDWNLYRKDMILMKADTMSMLASKCFEEFYPTPPLEPDCIRIVRFHEEVGVMDLSFEGKEDMSLGAVYRRPIKIERRDAFFLEVKGKEEEFEVYQTTDIVFKTYLIKSVQDVVVRIREIHMKASNTIGELRLKVSKVMKLPVEGLKMIVIIGGAGKLLSDDAHALGSLGLKEPYHEFFVENLFDTELGLMWFFVQNHYDCRVFNLECHLSAAHWETLALGSQYQIEPELTQPIVINDKFNPNIINQYLQLSSQESTNTGRENSDGPLSELRTLTLIDSEALEDGELFYHSESNDEANQVVPTREPELITTFRPFFRIVKELTPKQDVKNKEGDVKPAEDLSNKDVKTFMVKMEKKMSLKDLSRKVQALIKLDESDFVLYQVLNQEEVEITDYSATVESLNIDLLRVKLARRLLSNEGRVNIFLLELDKATNKHLFLKAVVLNTLMTVKQAKAAIEEALLTLPDFNTEILKCYRLRKKSHTTPSRVMLDGHMITEWLAKMSGDLFLQPLKEPDLYVGPAYHLMLVRRWSPSQLNLGPPAEFIFRYDYTEKLELLLAKKICEIFGIETESLEVALPDTEYPHELNPVTVHEVLVWFKLDDTSTRHISIHNDEGVIFARDKTETLKILSPEKRRIFEDEAMAFRRDYTIPIPKRNNEAGVFIDLSRTPPA